MLTPKGSRKIELDPKILSLVEEIDRIKPSVYESEHLDKRERKTILSGIDIEKLGGPGVKKGKSQYSKTELLSFAKNLGIEQAQKLSKEDLMEKIRDIVIESQDML